MFRLFLMMGLLLSYPFQESSADKKVPTSEEILTANGVGLKPDALTSALSNSNPEVREKAALLLGANKEKSALPELKKLLADNYIYARLAAAYALGKLGDQTGLEVLKTALNDNDAYIVAYASSRLIELGDRSGYDAMLKTLKSSNVPGEKIQALRSIGHFKGLVKESKIVDVLDKVLKEEKNDSVRRVAASELKNYSGDKVQNIFKRLIKDKDNVVQGLAKKYSEAPNP